MTLSRLYHGDCQDILGLALADNSIDSSCALEGFGFTGIELQAEYIELARARIAAVRSGKDET